MTFGQRYIKPGTAQDASVVNLALSGQAPVVIDRVNLVPDPVASPVRLEAAFVAPPTVVQRVSRVHAHDRWPAAVGYCLDPNTDAADTPVLVLRISPTGADGRRLSRNNAVNVHYRTPDGHRWVAAYPFRFEYPNRP